MAYGEDLAGSQPDGDGGTADPFDWPAFGLEDDMRPALARAVASGGSSALATLYAVEGGAPRGIGAQMLFSDDGMAGFLSGGCIEADVARHADAAMRDNRPCRLVYGDGGPADISLPCGSRIEVLVEALAPDDPAVCRLLDLGAARRPALWLSDGEARACVALDEPTPALPPSLAAAFDCAGESGEVAGCSTSPFAAYRLYEPALRLVIVGGDPIAMALARLASEMEIETVMVRPKGPASPPPGAVSYHRSLDSAFAETPPDPWTALAILTHDGRQEHDVLKAALETNAGYIGALGSARRAPERLVRLRADGIAEDRLAQLHAPIGLPIGGKSPWAIAVSIIAEIVAEIGRRAA